MADRRLFEVRHERPSEDLVLVVVSGEIDLATSGALKHALATADAPRVVLDLREVTFMDSSGLGVVVAHSKRARESGTRFGVAVAGAPAVRRILELSGLGQVLELLDDPSQLPAG